MLKVACDLKFFEGISDWPEVLKICKNLQDHGYQAFLAGGCVRDLVMRRRPKDFDIATNALPEQILELYPDALSVGREFGVIILAFKTFQIEIASFRKDGPYLDGRRPASIHFTNAEEDARRRDFTVNALFLDIANSEIIDYVSGLQDIRAKVIRAVGDPFLRFAEDKLRMLRAIRFSSQLEFVIEEKTFAAIRAEHSNLSQVSGERINDEIVKWLSSKNLANGLTSLWTTGLLLKLHPIFEKQFLEINFKKLLGAFSNDLRTQSLTTKISLLFSFIIQKNQPDELEILKQSLKELKFSKDQILATCWTLTNYFSLRRFDHLRLSDQIELVAHPFFKDLEGFTEVSDPELLAQIHSKISEIKTQFLKEGSLPAAYLNGEIMKSLGVPAGREMGELLKEAYRLQLEKKLLDRDEAIQYIKNQRKG